MKKIVTNHKLTLLGIFIILYFMVIYVIDIKFTINNYELLGAIIITGIIMITNFSILKQYRKEKRINHKKILLAIILIGMVLRTIYILYTPITERQHDMEEGYGHLAYIETIYQTGKLPTTNRWQFYQQPLHHIIAAGWIKVNELVGVDLETSKEGIQILTAIYSSMILLITYSILKEIGIKDKWKNLIMILVAVHPTFILLAGSINNDILLILLTFLGLLYLIKWHKNPNMKNTIILAIITAMIALTKISGTIIAIPILYIFIQRFLKDYTKEKNLKTIKRYGLKFGIFGIISLGLGLSYSMRNLVEFGQSIFYVPLPGSGLYCGNRSLFSRFSPFSSEWKTIFCTPFEDGNVIVYLVKSSLFGEYHLENEVGKVISSLLLIVNIAVIFMSLVTLIRLWSKKNKSVLLNLFLLFWGIEMMMYLYSNLSMPYGCTMDFRYIVPTILFGGLFIVEDEKNQTKLYEKIVNITTIIFAILSILFELTYMSQLTI